MNAVLSLTPRFVDNVKAGNGSECVRGGGILLLPQVHTLISMCYYFSNNSFDFLCRLDACLELLIRTGRLPEAAFLARTYLPSQVSRYALSLGRNVSAENRAQLLHLFGSLMSLILGWWSCGGRTSQKSTRKQQSPLLTPQSMKTFSLD